LKEEWIPAFAGMTEWEAGMILLKQDRHTGMTMEACIPYCPIREISVERGGTRGPFNPPPPPDLPPCPFGKGAMGRLMSWLGKRGCFIMVFLMSMPCQLAGLSLLAFLLAFSTFSVEVKEVGSGA
jgi:hypothetical protein